jgi:formate dehydrogenase
MDRGITVTEVAYCNSISASEQMMILSLVRNYIPGSGHPRRTSNDCPKMDQDGEWPPCGNRTIGRGTLGAKVGRVSKMAGCWISWTAGMLVALNINWAWVVRTQ